MKRDLLCIKLGGSVITDKKIPYQAKKKTIQAIANTLRQVDQPLFISHGVGSFAHTSAAKYGGKHGYTSSWGVAKVAHDADVIHNIVMEILIETGLPVISFSPRSFFLAEKGKVKKNFFDPIVEALSQGLTPVVYGDVIWDTKQQSTIFSGETTLNLICRYLQKSGFTIPKIVQLSNTDGVSDLDKKIIPEITRDNWIQIKTYIQEMKVTDVTGGMQHKVEDALSLTKNGIETWIINGNTSKELTRILKKQPTKGTVIR